MKDSSSQLVFYSPAITELSLLFSIELSVDRDFSSEIGDALAKAVGAAGALPVFAPAAPYLVAAGVAIPIASKAVNMLARPRTFLEEHVELNFARPGIELAQPGALILYQGGDDRPLGGDTDWAKTSSFETSRMTRPTMARCRTQ